MSLQKYDFSTSANNKHAETYSVRQQLVYATFANCCIYAIAIACAAAFMTAAGG